MMNDFVIQITNSFGKITHVLNISDRVKINCKMAEQGHIMIYGQLDDIRADSRNITMDDK